MATTVAKDWKDRERRVRFQKIQVEFQKIKDGIEEQ
jgi:hypothetical protein